MLAEKVACPRCQTLLEAARPLPPGKQVTCPHCRSAFALTPDGPVLMGTPASMRLRPTPPPPRSVAVVASVGPRPVPVAPPPGPAPQGNLPLARLGVVLAGTLLFVTVGSGLAWYCLSSREPAVAAAPVAADPPATPADDPRRAITPGIESRSG